MTQQKKRLYTPDFPEGMEQKLKAWIATSITESAQGHITEHTCLDLADDILFSLVAAIRPEWVKSDDDFDEEKWGFMAHEEVEDRSLDSDPFEGDVDEHPY